ncbi:MAG: transposase [Verrucomicrobiales bacterium]|nr:transposase [Verrucomicrobiales bacterium]HQW28800.1 transposase [Verrucomicrobiales bacterium]
MSNSGKHLRRLDRIFTRSPVYFITTTVAGRRGILNSSAMQDVVEEVWSNGESLYGWSVGPYVIMPDHVHFFCRETSEAASSLSSFVGKWKEWTSKYGSKRLEIALPLWQAGFFDHVLRSGESLREKIEYVWHNPVRGGLVDEPEDWPFKGNPGNWGVYDGEANSE